MDGDYDLIMQLLCQKTQCSLNTRTVLLLRVGLAHH